MANLAASGGDAARTTAMTGAAPRLLESTGKDKGSDKERGGPQRAGAGGGARAGEGAWWVGSRSAGAIGLHNCPRNRHSRESAQSLCCQCCCCSVLTSLAVVSGDALKPHSTTTLINTSASFLPCEHSLHSTVTLSQEEFSPSITRK
jgi:hypothetical protein